MNGLRPSWVLLGLAAVGSVACSSKPPPTAPFVFNRPERVEFVCIIPEGSSSLTDAGLPPTDASPAPTDLVDAGVAPEPLVVPLACCAPKAPLRPGAFLNDTERARICGTDPPLLHALVTQTIRGEVAAVDLINQTVLDSDPRIPGYTFVDVGGLPRAIVTPSSKPGDETAGPPWTYIVSGEDRVLRAIATCQFRQGAKCGPQATRTADKLQVPLPAQPKDMVLGPDGALWITLPDIAALARVALPTTGEEPFVSQVAELFHLPVVADKAPASPIRETPEYETACGLGYTAKLGPNALKMPTHEVAKGQGKASPTRIRLDATTGLIFVADATQPVLHVLSLEKEGVRVRGNIATGAPIRDFALTELVPRLAKPPRSFVDTDTHQAAPFFGPDEVRYLYAIDDRDGSVLVHTFSYTGGVVATQPLLLPAARRWSDRLNLDAAAIAIDFADNRPLSNGFVCDWSHQAGSPFKSSPKAPKVTLAGEIATASKDFFTSATPALRDAEIAYAGSSRAKRPAAKVALDKAQAKYQQTLLAYVGLVAQQTGVGDAISAAQSELDKAQTALTKAEDAYDKLPLAERLMDGPRLPVETARAVYNAHLDVYDALVADQSILSTVGPSQFRGVFGVITTLNGLLAVVDIHDLDVFCRGEQWCATDTTLVDDSSAVAVGVRRHTVRLGATAAAPLTVSDTTSFDKLTCEDGRYPAALRGAQTTTPGAVSTTDAGTSVGVADASTPDAGAKDAGASTPVTAPTTSSDTEVILCSVADPWLNVGSPGWSATWEGTVFAALSGRFESKGTTFSALLGVNLCERGVLGGDSDVEPNYQGDWLVITGQQPSYAPVGCVQPEVGFEPYFRIKQAFRDHLVIEPGAKSPPIDFKCYPDVVSYEIRAAERFFVYPRTYPYFHRVIAGPDGRCVADPTKDSKLVSRAEPGKLFENAFATFQISNSAAQDRAILIDVEPSLGFNTQFQPPVASSSASAADSLPVSVRYLGITGDVFVVDVAQGLLQFGLVPYLPNTTPYR